MSEFKYRIMKLYKYPLQDFEDNIIDPDKDIYEFVENKVFGHHDGLTTASVDSTLFALYVQQGLQGTQKENEYLDYQSFVMFVKNEKEDADFWENSKNYNFLFVCFLHLPKVSFKDNKIKLEHFLKEKSLRNKNVHFHIYETLDNADFILCVSSNQFRHGVQFLKDMYLNCPIDYIYTFLSSHKERIQNWKDEQEILHNVIIRYMINIDHKDEIEGFNNELKAYFDKHNIKISMKKPNLILGHDDISFIIPEIPAKILMNLFSHGQLLDENNEKYRRCVCSSDTRFGELIDNITIEKGTTIPANSKHSLFMYQKNKDFYAYLNVESDIDKASLNLMFHGLGEILKLMMKHEQSKGADYVYLTLYKPMKMLMEKIENHLKHKTLTRGHVRDVLTFLEDSSFILTRSNDSSLQLFQLPISLNHLYEASGKLISFYSAYMNEIKKILNTSDNEYAFLVSPLLKDMTEVQILFSDEIPANRLIMVKVATSDFYDSKKLLPILTHELSHFVGDKERCRGERVSLTIKVLLASLMEYIFDSQIRLMFESEHIDSIIQDLTNELYNSIKQSVQTNIQEQNNRQVYQNAVSLIMQLYEDIALLLNENTLNSIFKKFRDKNLVRETYDESYIYRHRYLLFENYVGNKWNNLIRENAHFYIIKKFVEMSRECYADLVMVKFLDLSIAEYLDTFQFAIQNGNAESEEEMNVDLIVRLTVIVDYLLTHGHVYKRRADEKDYIKNVFTFLETKDEEIIRSENSILIFEISCNYEFLLEYLNACGKNLDVHMKTKEQKIKSIQKMYKKIDTEEFPNIINYFNDALRNELMQGI